VAHRTNLTCHLFLYGPITKKVVVVVVLQFLNVISPNTITDPRQKYLLNFASWLTEPTLFTV
jgi:hypothetical protein